MKKILLVSLVMLLAVSVSYSQIGIKGGLNLGTARGDDVTLNPAMFDASFSGLPSVSPTKRTGFVAGLSYKAGFIPILGIQIEALYTQKGAVYEFALPASMGGVDVKGTFKLDYIDIPVLIKFSPLPLPVVSPYLEAGVSYGILLGAKFKAEAGGQSAEEDIKDGLVKSDLSILIGAGAEISIIDINVRFVLGQTKLMKDSDAKFYNSGLQFTAALRF
jgi:hypothetical protein